MSTTYEKISSNKVRLQFVVEAADFEKAMQAAYKKTVGRLNIPGFRKGKAPRKVIENFYGESIFYDEAIDALVPELYRAAIAEYQLQPVDRPELEIKKIGNGEPCELTLEVFVQPDVTLGDYKAIRAERTVTEVTDDDVTAELERARERVARYNDITDRAVKMDDRIKLDYAGFCEGDQFEGGTATEQTLVIGSGSFIPGFEEQLVGAEIGKEVEVNVTFPTEYHAENLAGKPATFKCTVRGIQEKELPALDDEFAKDVSEFDTLEAYRSDIRAKLEKRANDEADNALEEAIIEKLQEVTTVDIPDAMVEDELDALMNEMETSMRYQGFTLQMFLQYTNQTMDDLRAQRKDDAATRVKTRLAIEALRKEENITAEEEDVDKVLAEYAERRGKTLDEYKSNLSNGEKTYMTEIAATRKTLELLKTIASGK